MSRVDGSINSLIQGVSQQPAKTRLPGQCTAQLNCSSNPVDGLTRRPPLEHIARLITSSEGIPTSDMQFYDLKMGADRKYIVVAFTGGIKVFDRLGVEQDVLIENPRVNLLTYSNDLPASVWTKSATTIQENVDGVADKVKTIVTTTNFSVYQTSSVSRDKLVTAEAIVKVDDPDIGFILQIGDQTNMTGNRLTITCQDPDDNPAVVTGNAYGLAVLDSYGVDAVGDGYYRYWVRGVVDSASTAGIVIRLGLMQSSTGNTNFLGDGSSGPIVDGIYLYEDIGQAADYLNGDPLCFATLENDTFIANRKKIVEMAPADDTQFVKSGSIVSVLGGQYNRTYRVDVTWYSGGSTNTAGAQFTTPDGSSVTHTPQVATNYICNQLATQLAATNTFGLNTTFDFIVKGDTMYIQWKPVTGRVGDPFSVTVTDGDGGTHLKVANGAVQNVGLLPRFAPHGYHIAIIGDGGADVDDWYVRFELDPVSSVIHTPGSGFGQNGKWVETHQKGVPSKMINTTLPHILEYRELTDDFRFYTPNWAGRQVGDRESNPDPTFVGRTIEDIAYFQGRLVLLSGPAVMLSRTNRPLDFWIESATTSTDSDAIDIESTAQGVSKMLKAIPHNRDLVIFSDGGQFIVFGRNALTPENSSLVLTTSFEANVEANPVPAGRNIYFAINYGNYGGVREFYTEGAEDVNDSRPITQHVLKYIKGQIKRLAATSSFDTLLVQADDPTLLYVYEYIWVDNQKAQSSWSTWKVPNPVLFTFFDESVIYILSDVNGELILEQLDLDIHEDEGISYTAFLDRKVHVHGVNSTITGLLPSMPDIDQMIFVQGEGCPFPGLRVLVDNYDAGTDTITLQGDMQGGTVIAGQRFLSSYTPTMPVIRDRDGSAVGTGKLIISKFFINTQRTGVVEIEVTSPYREPRVLRFIGRYIGNPNSVIGEAAIMDSSLIAPFRDNTENGEIRIFTDTHLPMTLMDIEWVGQYTKRGTRVTQGG